jgi:hypothetical protein
MPKRYPNHDGFCKLQGVLTPQSRQRKATPPKRRNVSPTPRTSLRVGKVLT